MFENEELDVKDFPLFDSTSVDYYTYAIVSGEQSYRNARETSLTTMFESGNGSSTRKTENEMHLDTYKEPLVTIKVEPIECSETSYVALSDVTRDLEADTNTSKKIPCLC